MQPRPSLSEPSQVLHSPSSTRPRQSSDEPNHNLMKKQMEVNKAKREDKKSGGGDKKQSELMKAVKEGLEGLDVKQETDDNQDNVCDENEDNGDMEMGGKEGEGGEDCHEVATRLLWHRRKVSLAKENCSNERCIEFHSAEDGWYIEVSSMSSLCSCQGFNLQVLFLPLEFALRGFNKALFPG